MSTTNELLRKWLEKFGDAWDAGPPREGWQSDELLALIEQTRAALVERKVEPLEHVEKVSTEAAMSQWERSLKRPDLCEKDRVRGAIEAYKRQAFAFAISPTPPAAPVSVQDIAHKLTGLYGSTCCHRTGGKSDDPDCECRKVAAEIAALSASPSPVDSREVVERCAQVADAAALAASVMKDRKDARSASGTAILTGYIFAETEAKAIAAKIRALAAKEQQP